SASQWTHLGNFILAPGYSDEIIYAYLARGLTKLETPPDQDNDEDIEVVLMTPTELETAILAGEPVDAKSISSFLLAKPHLSS
ncbi:MAG: NUDIX hydrolase, partial [Coleofasciculaceae cyanobacterium RL_1_1]|nr:NUDIX hydrolase [Coleofasciculaceae cyanobacterium RL_1_1]